MSKVLMRCRGPWWLCLSFVLACYYLSILYSPETQELGVSVRVKPSLRSNCNKNNKTQNEENGNMKNQRSVLFIGDSVDRFMMLANTPGCKVVEDSFIGTMSCSDLVRNIHFSFIHNRMDVSTDGPWNYIERTSNHSVLVKALTEMGKAYHIDEVWVAVNFWTLARLRQWGREELFEFDVDNPFEAPVAQAWGRNLTNFFELVLKTIPNAKRYGWMERHPAIRTENKVDYFYGNRISTLNQIGSRVAAGFGWRSYRSFDRKVPLRDAVHPSDEALRAILSALVGPPIDDQSHTSKRRPLASIDSRDKVLFEFPVEECQYGSGQLVMGHDVRVESNQSWHLMKKAKYACDVAWLGSSNPCMVYSFGSRDEISFEVGLNTQAPQCEVHVFDSEIFPDETSQKRYNFTSHHFGIGTKDQGNMRTLRTIMAELKHTHVNVLRMDIDETGVLKYLQREGSLELIDQISIKFHSVDALKVGMTLMTQAGFEMKYARRGDWCPVCTDVALQKKKDKRTNCYAQNE